MRSVRNRRPATFFRGTEFARLMTLVVMLGVLVLLMDRARDPHTWTWVAPNDTPAQVVAQGNVAAERPAAIDARPAGPTDLDADQREAAREELAAVTDRVPLGAEEMPAYWRLMAWELRQTTAELEKRADTNVTFRDFWQQPQEWRGKLVKIRVHLRRTLAVKNLADNPLGLKNVSEVWGWNSDSQPYWYWMVVPELPPAMPQGENIEEEGTFVGYFLKLLPYEDHEGKTRATPLLIGRLIWHPAPNKPILGGEWKWTWYLVVALAVLFAVRWGMVLLGRARHGRSSPSLAASSDERAVEAWLEGSDDAIDDGSIDPDPMEPT